MNDCAKRAIINLQRIKGLGNINWRTASSVFPIASGLVLNFIALLVRKTYENKPHVDDFFVLLLIQ